MKIFTVVMPVYNVEAFIKDAIDSVLTQTFADYELLIIDDCGSDASIEICQQYNDPRIRIIKHEHNKGLAAARNTGIRNAKGKYVAFLDADDTWHKSKLALHYTHMEQNPEVGLSFSRSEFMDADGNSTNCYQMPRLTNIFPKHVFLRNPIGNGSAPVLRIEALNEISYQDDNYTEPTLSYFDENLRRSEDIDCWIRVALQTKWVIEGLPQPLTFYRLNAGGLSSSLDKQYESWLEVLAKVEQQFPVFAELHGLRAKAYQQRYLARQAIRLGLGKASLTYLFRAFKTDKYIFLEEPGRSFATFVSGLFLFIAPKLFVKCEQFGMNVWGKLQSLKMKLNAN